MLPDTLNILGITFHKAAEDSQTGSLYLDSRSTRSERTSFSVRKVSKDTQPFTRYLFSFRAPSSNMVGSQVAVNYSSPIVVNTTVTIPNSHNLANTDVSTDTLLLGLAIPGVVMLDVNENPTSPETTSLTDFGTKLLVGHQ